MAQQTMTAAVAPPVMIFEESFKMPAAPLSPKVKALRDRLANQMCEKDDINVKDKVEKLTKDASSLSRASIASCFRDSLGVLR